MRGIALALMLVGQVFTCKEAVVVDYTEDLVTIECNGSLYDFYGEGYEVDDTITVRMIDDKVVDVAEWSL